MSQKPKILVIDDEEAILALIHATLEDAFAISTARDGEQGLQLARLERPDFILLDARVPRKDGFALCRELRSDPATRGAPVLIMTATDTLEYRQRASEAGAEGFLAKPFSPKFLLNLLLARLNLAQKASSP